MPDPQNRQKEKVHNRPEKSFPVGHLVFFGRYLNTVGKKRHESDKENEDDLAGKIEVKRGEAIDNKTKSKQIRDQVKYSKDGC